MSFTVRGEGRQPSQGLLKVGPLAARGLLQELAGPLAYGASSEVFTDRTGLAVDRSLDRPTGFALGSGSFGLFLLPSASGSAELGAFLSGAPAPWCRLEAAVCYSEPRADVGDESWFRDGPPWPGGGLVNAGARFQARLCGASFGGVLGCSAARLAPPGCFAEVRGSLEAPRLRVGALVGASTAGYRSPSGEGADAALHLSARLELSGSTARATATGSREIGRPGFAPRPYIRERRRAGLSFEQTIPLGPLQARLRLEGTKRTELSAAGTTSEEAGWRIALDVSGPRADVSTSLSWSAEEGTRVGLTVELAPTGGIELSVDADWRERQTLVRLAVTWTVRGVDH